MPFDAELRPICPLQELNDLTIRRLLHHSDVSVTRRSYTKRLHAQAVDAMNVFQAHGRRS